MFIYVGIKFLGEFIRLRDNSIRIYWGKIFLLLFLERLLGRLKRWDLLIITFCVRSLIIWIRNMVNISENSCLEK